MKRLIVSLVTCVLALGMLGQAQPAANPHNLPDGLYGELTTEAGVVVYELFYKKAPMTVANHVGLAEGTLGPSGGKPFYDGLKWHRVEANFVIQGGDGNANWGRLGYSFPDEIVPGLRHDGPGTVQMANSGPDTNGSQFCFMLSDQTGLNYNHTVFGKVVRGLELLPNIKVGDSMKIRILRVGDDARAFKVDAAAFKALTDKAVRFTGPRAPGPEAFLDDPDNIIGTAGRGSTFLQYKLANFERFTGERIIARIYRETPPDAQGNGLEAFLQDLATRRQVSDKGALVVYFQDQDKWAVRVGMASRETFAGGPMKADGTRDPVPAGSTYDQALAEFMALVTRPLPARGGTGRAAATAPASAPAAAAATGRGRGRGAPGTPGMSQRLGIVLDNLIFRLEPGSKARR